MKLHSGAPSYIMPFRMPQSHLAEAMLGALWMKYAFFAIELHLRKAQAIFIRKRESRSGDAPLHRDRIERVDARAYREQLSSR